MLDAREPLFLGRRENVAVLQKTAGSIVKMSCNADDIAAWCLLHWIRNENKFTMRLQSNPAATFLVGLEQDGQTVDAFLNTIGRQVGIRETQAVLERCSPVH